MRLGGALYGIAWLVTGFVAAALGVVGLREGELLLSAPAFAVFIASILVLVRR
jgi:hypothetical protein